MLERLGQLSAFPINALVPYVDWLDGWVRRRISMMKKRRQLGRFVILVAVGGCLLQVAGCLTGLLPVVGGLAEAAALRGLLRALG